MTKLDSGQSRTLQLPLDEMQHFVLHGVTWAFYEHLLEQIGNGATRVTYDQGSIEIMSPLPEHERPKTLIGQLIRTLAYKLEIPMASFGSTTYRREDLEKGLEPDECFYFKNEPLMRAKKRINLPADPAPDLAIEIDIFSRSIARLPIYAALGTPEVWRYDDKQIHCLHLFNREYVEREKSLAFSMLNPRDLEQFINRVGVDPEMEIIRSFEKWISQMGWAKP